METKILPDVDYINSRFSYDENTGILSWKKCSTHNKSWNTRYAGKEAGKVFSTKHTSYIVVRLDGKTYFAHRLIWKMIHKVEPIFIDHQNGNGLDNRLSNLRNVSHSVNHQNVKLQNNNTSGVCGVHWMKDRNLWCARIKVNQRIIQIGKFKTLEDAIQARKKAEQQYGFHENHGVSRESGEQ